MSLIVFIAFFLESVVSVFSLNPFKIFLISTSNFAISPLIVSSFLSIICEWGGHLTFYITKIFYYKYFLNNYINKY